MGDLNVNEFSKESRVSILRNWMEEWNLRRVYSDYHTHWHHVFKRWSHLDGILCHEDEHLDVFTMIEGRTGQLRISDHYPILTKINLEIDEVQDTGAAEKEEYMGDRWKLDRTKIEETNERLKCFMEKVLEEIPREETEARLRTTIIGIRNIFNEKMPKTIRKFKGGGRFGTRKENKLKEKLKILNKKKKGAFKIPVRGLNLIKKYQKEQKEILSELIQIQERRKRMEVQKMRHIIRGNPNSVYDMIKRNKILIHYVYLL